LSPRLLPIADKQLNSDPPPGTDEGFSLLE
jgi:hypothetical protein